MAMIDQTSVKTIRIGLIVGDSTSASHQLAALSSLSGVELVAVSGDDPIRVRAEAARFHIPECYEDYRQMLRRCDLDAVVIAATLGNRHSAAIAAAERGVHILCGAPMARSAAEARDMLRLARDTGVCHAVGYADRYYPERARVKELVDAGYLGDLQSVNVTAYRVAPVRHGTVDRDLTALRSLGSAYADFLRWCFGDIHAVAGATAHDGARVAGDNFGVVMRFACGAVGTAHVSTTSPVSLGDEVVAIGTDGVLALRGDGRVFGTRRHTASLEPIAVAAAADASSSQSGPGERRRRALSALTGDWLRTIGDGTVADRMPTFDDGVKALEVVDAVARSQELSRWVDLSGRRWPH